MHVSEKVFLWEHNFFPISMTTMMFKKKLTKLSICLHQEPFIFSANMAIHRQGYRKGGGGVGGVGKFYTFPI